MLLHGYLSSLSIFGYHLRHYCPNVKSHSTSVPNPTPTDSITHDTVNTEEVDLSVVLINWRFRDDLEACLAAIGNHRHACSVEVLVVNKPSDDGAEEMVRQEYPGVRFFSRDGEFRFSMLRNVGLDNARGRFCLVLDTDIDIKPGCFDAMVAFMDRHPELAGCGGHTTRLNGEIEYNVKRFYDFATVLARRSLLPRIWPKNPWSFRHLMLDKDHNKPFFGDWMAGACFCMRREAIEQVGLFDEKMHYFEDVDWCWRAKRAGWKIAFNPYARIVHKVQRASGQSYLSRQAWVHLFSGLRFWWKVHHQGLNWAWPLRPAPRLKGEELVRMAREDKATAGPDLSVVVINLNGKQLLDDCLRSLRQAAPRHRLETIVVDNGSTDGSAAMVREKYPEAILIENDENLGFTKANNQGVHQSTGRYIMLLNNDTRVVPGAFSKAIEFMDETPGAGAAGLKLLNEDGSLQLSCRRFPSFSQALFSRYSLLTKLWPGNPFSAGYLMTDFEHDRIQEVDWVSGACLLFRRSVLRRIGALDERFFMYSEDVDYCYRVWELGWKVVYYPNAEVYHLIGQDTKKVRVKLTLERHKSMYKFYKKHYSRNLMFIDLVTGAMISVRCGLHLLKASIDAGVQRLRGGNA